jgi:hypothetical protein
VNHTELQPRVTCGVVEPRLVPACAAAVQQVEWRALVPLLAFVAVFHVTVAAVLLTRGLPVGYLPQGEWMLVGVFSAGVLGCAIHILAGQVAGDWLNVRHGRPVPPPAERVAGFVRISAAGVALAVVFTLVMLANANLKPALGVLNPRTYDLELEAIERALCFGVLPSEWLVTRTSPAALKFWDFVYGSFALYLLVSVMLAVYREGLRGGARLVLALAAGLWVTLALSLVVPTWGPIYTHPEWYHVLLDCESGHRARALAASVRLYADEPAVRYAVAGISAMPSYHVLAWACAGLLAWGRHSQALGIVGAVMVLLNWISTVVLGWHYALDGLVAIGLAVIACRLAERMIPARPGPNSGQTPGRGQVEAAAAV